MRTVRCAWIRCPYRARLHYCHYYPALEMPGYCQMSLRDKIQMKLAFTGRDTAPGKPWEAWMKKYAEKKARGKKDLSLHSESPEE